MENQTENMTFNMDALMTNLPHKRGLSKFYSGKSRSFTCMADVQCLEDLKKQQHPDAKKRKTHSDRNNMNVPPYPCRRTSSTTQCASPCVGA